MFVTLYYHNRRQESSRDHTRPSVRLSICMTLYVCVQPVTGQRTVSFTAASVDTVTVVYTNTNLGNGSWRGSFTPWLDVVYAACSSVTQLDALRYRTIHPSSEF